MTEKAKRKPYHEEFAEKIIEALKTNSAPWQKPWEPGVVHAPFNPESGTVYKGVNCMNLFMNGYDDPRYMTLKQANNQEMRVKKGEKAHRIVYCVFEESQPKFDADGKPVLDEDGQPEMEKVKLDRPKIVVSGVFHMTQLQRTDGLEIEPWTNPIPDWVPEERAEKILENCGVSIHHDQSNRAYYSPINDEVHLPPRSKFKEAARYYAVALHEINHSTGHETRLNRDLNGPFGSEKYAREELRAEIASWMIGNELGIGHDPQNHTAYVQSWIKMLEDDPYEIVRACRDAEKIKQVVLGYELGLEHEKVQEVTQEVSEVQAEALNPAKEKTFLSVPYAERQVAKKAGAKWDREAKLWFVEAGTDLAPLNQYLPQKELSPQLSMSPQEQFYHALEERGFDLNGQAPVMDGKIHRVPVKDRAPGNLDGAYCAYLDGVVPAGWTQNFASGETRNWGASGHVLTEEQKQTLKMESEQRKQFREQETKRTQDIVAVKCREYLNERYPASSEHTYLQAKGVISLEIKESPSGRELLIPMRNKDGEIRSIQYIAEDGSKRFEPGGQKKGCFHLIGKPAENSPDILVCEGYATGASLHQATGLPVAVAFDAGNLKPVAVALKEKIPSSTLTICADNDHSNKFGNIGVEKAQEAAMAVSGNFIVPKFSAEEMSRGLKDFNDLHKEHGLKRVQSQAVKQTLAKSQETGKAVGL